MADKSKPEMAPQRRSLKLSPALGDWTSYKPPRSLVKKVKIGLYGFDRLSDDDFKEAHLIHYRFGENILKDIKINFKSGGELFSVEAMQGSYGNFIKNIAGPLLQGKLEVSEFHDDITLCMDMGLINSIVNASLGLKDTKNFGVELTEAEKIIVETSLSQYLTSSLNQAFKDTLKGINFEIVGSPDFAPDTYLSAASTFVYFAIEISLGETQGKIIVGYSGSLIKNLLKKSRLAEKPQSLSLEKMKGDILNKSAIDINAVLGKTELKGGELYSLEIGDVVSLDNSIHSAIQVRVAENGKVILAQPGVMNNKIIVRIVGIEKEKEVRVPPPLPAEAEKISEEAPEEELPEEELLEEEFPEEELPEEELLEEELPEEELPEEELPEEELPEEELEFPEEKEKEEE